MKHKKVSQLLAASLSFLMIAMLCVSSVAMEPSMRIGSVTVHSSLFAKMASESPEKDLITQSNIVKATDEMIQFEEKTVLDQIVLRGELSYPVPLGDDARGNITRLDNAIGNFADRIADADAALDSLEQQKQAAEVEIAKPFAQEEELQTKSARLAELDALLNMEHQSSRTEPEAEEKPDARPSVLAALEEKADKVEPVRPFKSYLDKDGDAR